MPVPCLNRNTRSIKTLVTTIRQKHSLVNHSSTNMTVHIRLCISLTPFLFMDTSLLVYVVPVEKRSANVVWTAPTTRERNRLEGNVGLIAFQYCPCPSQPMPSLFHTLSSRFARQRCLKCLPIYQCPHNANTTYPR